MDEGVIRDQLAKALDGEYVHASFEEAVADFPLERINEQIPNGDYTPWRLLEHIRRASHDMVAFIEKGPYKELKWPEDYWPKEGEKADAKRWRETIEGFLADREKLIEMIGDPKVDLTAPLLHRGIEYTLMRQIRIEANHVSYHVGEFCILRQVMGTWPKGRG